MTRHWPTYWTTPSRLAVCLLVLGSPLGCGLSKAPVAANKATEQATEDADQPIQPVGFISTPRGNSAAADPWQATDGPAPLELTPLPPVDQLVVRGEGQLPVERAEDVYGEASPSERPRPLPAPLPLADPLAATNPYGPLTALPDPTPSATCDKQLLVDPSAPIPVFSTLDLEPFEVVDDEQESLALAPPQISPPSPTEAAGLPIPNLAVALRGEKKNDGSARRDTLAESTTRATQRSNSTPGSAHPRPAGTDVDDNDAQATRYEGATLPPEPEPTDETTSTMVAGQIAEADGTAAGEDNEPDTKIVAAEVDAPPESSDDETDTTEPADEPALAASPRDSDRSAAPPADAWQRAAESTPTTPTPTTANPLATYADEVDANPTLHPVATGVPTGAKVNEQAAAKIRHGYSLAQRGAYYSARGEFISVLKMLAQGKDHLTGRPRRSRALSAGLRALDEVSDFAPAGGALDADVDLSVITSSHRTPVAKTQETMLPQQLMDVYFRYAQVQLGAAVAGEPAGSMALHALGKLHSQLGRVEAEHHPLATRFAYTYQQAALLAHNENHLAAHELGVLMAESGHYREAEDLLLQVASREPHPQVLQNLARVQQQLGHVRLAAETKQVAAQMRTRYGSANGISWVDPSVFSSQNRPNWQETSTPRVAGRPH